MQVGKEYEGNEMKRKANAVKRKKLNRKSAGHREMNAPHSKDASECVRPASFVRIKILIEGERVAVLFRDKE